MEKILSSGERISEDLDYNSFVEQRASYSFEISRMLEYNKDFVNKLIVDCASGEGYGTEMIKNRIPDSKVVGVDINEEAVSYSKQKYPKIDFSVGSILELEKIVKNFDYLISNQTLEHLNSDDQVKAINTIYSCLNPKGHFIIAVPNKPVYEIYSPNNIFHLNELDYNSLNILIKTQNWSKVEVFGQHLANYQKNSPFRKTKLFSYLLKLIPIRLLKILKGKFVPSISEEEIIIEEYKKVNDKSYKILIAFCYK